MPYTTTKGAKILERLENPERYAGHAVCDPQGRKIGRLEALLVNEHKVPADVRARIDSLEVRTVLIPVGVVARNERRCAVACW